MKAGIIVAMQSEYDALREAGVASVVLSGIGKASAARAVTELILTEHPDCIINSGVAGGLKDFIVKAGDVVIGSEVAYHDVWCGEPNERGQVQGLPSRFPADPVLLAKATALAASREWPVTIHTGLIASGDQFYISREEDARILSVRPDALASDMESGAIAQTCHHYGVPFLSIRSISDTHLTEEEMRTTYANFWPNLAKNSFVFLKALTDSLG